MGEDNSATIVRDPSKRSFWRTRNIILLVMTAFLPVAGKAAWDGSSKFLADVSAIQKRLDAAEDRLASLKEETSAKALWSALSEERNRNITLRIELEVMKRLFDREFAKAGRIEEELPAPDDVPHPRPAPAAGGAPKRPFTKDDAKKLAEDMELYLQKDAYKQDVQRRVELQQKK